MRILILTQYFPPEPGAPQVRLKELALGLRRAGHEVTVMTSVPNYPDGVIPPEYRRIGRGPIEESLPDLAGVRVWRTKIYPVRRGRFWKRLLNYFSFVYYAHRGLKSSRVGKHDVLIFESPPLFLGLTALRYGRRTQTRVIMNISDLWPESAVALGLVTSRWMIRAAECLERRLYRGVWKISVQTEGIRDSLLERGLPGEKVTFLPNGVNLDLFAPRERDRALAQALGYTDEDFILIYAGTLGYAQGLESVLAAAELLLPERNVKFLFVGDGTEKPKLQEMVRGKDLYNVRFVDFQPVGNMPGYFSCASASIVPLKKSKLFAGARPSKMFPALASAVPVIYSGEGEAAALIQASGGGTVVEPENPAAMAQAIRELRGSPEDLRRMGREGRRFVEQQYGWARIIETWLNEVGLGIEEEAT
ncbi:MAG: glycosyltransferase family 4 protein [Peptococcaceae bacterium]|nr:glycosyltransferase family 4 protein [Peptococcaceae bacterium]